MKESASVPGRARRSGRAAWIRPLVREWILPVALMLAITTPLRSAMADWYDVPTGSMKPTILEGDRILVNNLAFGLRVPFTSKWMARWNTPHRGDIVTLSSPVDQIRLVKRVIGLPGDRLSLREGRLFLNGRALSYEEKEDAIPRTAHEEALFFTESLPGHPHLVRMLPNRKSWRNFPEFVVPPGRYFVMGDNRDESGDSRYFGFVAQNKIYGRASRVAFSCDPGHYHLPRGGRWLKPLV